MVRIERAYVIALTIIAITITLTQLISQRHIRLNRLDSTIVNISGRQRMLSQKIAKSAIQLVTATDSVRFINSQSELRKAVNLWAQSHRALQNGDDEMGISSVNNSDEILGHFEQIRPAFESIHKNAVILAEKSTFQTINQPSWQSSLQHILDHENDFLTIMDAITFQYDEEAQQRVTSLSRLEFGLYMVAIILLILEAIFIFRPALRLLKESTDKLIVSERNLEQARVEKQYTKQLETKNQELRQFVYITSHDLIEPLNTIISFSKILARNSSPMNELQQKSVDVINKSAFRMKDFMLSILEFSRIGREKTRTEVDLIEVIEKLKTDLHSLIEEKQASIQFVGESLKFGAYENDLTKLLQNLIVNGIKYGKKELKPEIILDAKEQKEVYLVSVKDNGIGIPEKYFERIFEVFQRLHTRDQYEGTGIGLAHCKKIVELHDGDIWVESEEGVGSTFYFTISKQPL